MTVSFLNTELTKDHSPQADRIAKHMVEWFLTDESVWKQGLGFAAPPVIIYMNSMHPTDATEYHFALYGGTKCVKPCSGSVGLVFVDGKPTNQYKGAVYEQGSKNPLAQLTHTIERGM